TSGYKERPWTETFHVVPHGSHRGFYGKWRLYGPLCQGGGKVGCVPGPYLQYKDSFKTVGKGKWGIFLEKGEIHALCTDFSGRPEFPLYRVQHLQANFFGTKVCSGG